MTVSKCSRPACLRKLGRHSNLCPTHHTVAKRMGLRGITSAKPTQDRINELLQLGWAYSDIAKAAEASPSFVRVHALRLRDKVRAEMASRVLSITAESPLPRTPYRTMDGTGFVRRIQALACLGWRYSDLTEHLGCSYQTVTAVPDRGVVSRALHAKMVDLYEKLQNTPGPSKGCAVKARNKNWHPPAAWDDIDDIREDPSAPSRVWGEVVDEVAVRRVVDGHASSQILYPSERDADARIMLGQGRSPNVIGARLRMSHHYLKKVAAA